MFPVVHFRGRVGNWWRMAGNFRTGTENKYLCEMQNKRKRGELVRRIDYHLAKWSLEQYERTGQVKFLRLGAFYNGNVKNERKHEKEVLRVQFNMNLK